MRKHELYTEYHDHFEYFGNTEIERIRKQGEKTIRHDWIIFDSTDEALSLIHISEPTRPPVASRMPSSA